MPVYASIHKVFLSGFTVSRMVTRAMSQAISEEMLFSISYVTVPNDTVAKYIARLKIFRPAFPDVNTTNNFIPFYLQRTR